MRLRLRCFALLKAARCATLPSLVLVTAWVIPAFCFCHVSIPFLLLSFCANACIFHTFLRNLCPQFEIALLAAYIDHTGTMRNPDAPF